MAKFDADKWLAMSAMIVSVGTLAALSYQSLLMRDSERASKLPYLYVQMQTTDTTSSAGILLANTGIGPALIDDVRVLYQGREIVSDPYDFYLSQRPDVNKPDSNIKQMSVDKVQHGRLVPAGTTIQMIGLGGKDYGLLMKDVLGLFQIAEVPRGWYKLAGLTGNEGAVIVITYTSVFGERWRVRSDRIVPDAL